MDMFNVHLQLCLMKIVDLNFKGFLIEPGFVIVLDKQAQLEDPHSTCIQDQSPYGFPQKTF